MREAAGRDFPDDPNEQLDLAIKAVFASWFGKRAHDYREHEKIPHDLGTAVNVVTMVFGNMGDDSGTGVAFTRDPNTGEKVLYGEYLVNAQGEDVVAGIRTAIPDRPAGAGHAEGLRRVQRGSPTSSRSTTATSRTSSSRSNAAASTCSRPATPSGRPPAAMRIAIDMVEEKLITRQEAVERVSRFLANPPRISVGRHDQRGRADDRPRQRLRAWPGVRSSHRRTPP